MLLFAPLTAVVLPLIMLTDWLTDDDLHSERIKNLESAMKTAEDEMQDKIERHAQEVQMLKLQGYVVLYGMGYFNSKFRRSFIILLTKFPPFAICAYN